MKLSRVRRVAPLAVLSSASWALSAHAAEPGRVYDANCAMCHQKAGAGLAGQFPRLAGRAGAIAKTPAGRRYLAQVTLFGMAGKVEVDGTQIIGVMPGFALLSDADLASALNYVIGLGTKGVAIKAADLKSVRNGEQLSPTQVRANRDALVVANIK